jgi:hypothetical protein
MIGPETVAGRCWAGPQRQQPLDVHDSLRI